MTTPQSVELRQRLERVITRRAGASSEVEDVSEAARLTHDDLTAMFAPLISSGGVSALWGRAFDLARRDYPVTGNSSLDAATDEPFAEMAQWLERQDRSDVLSAAAAMFAAFAELLTALIGEPLTTRYLEKAFPDGFPGAAPKGKKA